MAPDVRIAVRPRTPVLALLLLAPSLPELLTGSTPVSLLATRPLGFAVNFALDLGLYGTGALLIREAAVIFRRGWASVLLWGAAYGVAEEGLAVHTFFQRAGPPVGSLGSYGAAFGVDWLWALGLTVFHATYSIALPILLTRLAFPDVRDVRWTDRGVLAVVAAVYLAVVAGLGFAVGHGPSPSLLALFLGVGLILVVAGRWAPPNSLSVRPGARRIGALGLVGAGSVELIVWFGGTAIAPAVGAPAVAFAAFLVVANLAVLWLVLRRTASEGVEATEFWFAVGMLAPLFALDFLFESAIPGILGVTALFAYLLYRLRRALIRRGVLSPRAPTVPPSPS